MRSYDLGWVVLSTVVSCRRHFPSFLSSALLSTGELLSCRRMKSKRSDRQQGPFAPTVTNNTETSSHGDAWVNTHVRCVSHRNPIVTHLQARAEQYFMALESEPSDTRSAPSP